MTTEIRKSKKAAQNAAVLISSVVDAQLPVSKMLLHVNLPAELVLAVRARAHDERRTITSEVEILLEESLGIARLH